MTANMTENYTWQHKEKIIIIYLLLRIKIFGLFLTPKKLQIAALTYYNVLLWYEKKTVW